MAAVKQWSVVVALNTSNTSLKFLSTQFEFEYTKISAEPMTHILQQCISSRGHTLLWVYRQLIVMPYIALARQAWIYRDISVTIGRSRSFCKDEYIKLNFSDRGGFLSPIPRGRVFCMLKRILVIQGVSKKRYFSDFRLVSVLEIGFYIFTCDLESEP